MVLYSLIIMTGSLVVWWVSVYMYNIFESYQRLEQRNKFKPLALLKGSHGRWLVWFEQTYEAHGQSLIYHDSYF